VRLLEDPIDIETCRDTGGLSGEKIMMVQAVRGDRSAQEGVR
jgi:hypothetical protein